MSRHTLNDGITPDTRITLNSVEWRPRLAPPPRLIGDYYRRGLDWDDFERRYLTHLVDVAEDVTALRDESMVANITIMCIEDDCTRCHRRLLAEVVRSMRGSVSPDLR